MTAMAASSDLSQQALHTELSRMAALVESQLAGAISAFERREVAAAENLIEGDRRIDEFDRDIETRVMALLASGSLNEIELREVMTVMKMTGELERVGDLAKNVAKRTLAISHRNPASPTNRRCPYGAR